MAQPRHVGGDGVAGGRRWLITPDGGPEGVERDAVAGLEAEARQQSALAPAAGRDVGRPVPDPQRPKQPDFHKRTLAQQAAGAPHRRLVMPQGSDPEGLLDTSLIGSARAGSKVPPSSIIRVALPLGSSWPGRPARSTR